MNSGHLLPLRANGAETDFWHILEHTTRPNRAFCVSFGGIALVEAVRTLGRKLITVGHPHNPVHLK
jgi:hypothetical protein